MAFEWKIFPGFTTLGILEEIHKFMIELQCEPGQGDGVTKAWVHQTAAAPRGSRTRVCANTFLPRGGTRREGRTK